MLPEAVRAAESLATKGIQASVIDIHTVKPIDQETIIKYAKKCGCAVSAEEHNVMGGMGSAVAEVLTDQYPIVLKRVGVMDTFGESGEAQELLNKYGLTSGHIEEAARAAIAMKR
jgi:transketolase